MVANTTENSYYKADLKADVALNDMNNVNKITKYNVTQFVNDITMYDATSKFGDDDIVEPYNILFNRFTNFKLLKTGFYKITSVFTMDVRSGNTLSGIFSRMLNDNQEITGLAQGTVIATRKKIATLTELKQTITFSTILEYDGTKPYFAVENWEPNDQGTDRSGYVIFEYLNKL